MLSDHRVFPILLSTNLAASRTFYHDALGLETLGQDEDGLHYNLVLPTPAPKPKLAPAPTDTAAPTDTPTPGPQAP